jgi:hypothetical protein
MRFCIVINLTMYMLTVRKHTKKIREKVSTTCTLTKSNYMIKKTFFLLRYLWNKYCK